MDEERSGAIGPLVGGVAIGMALVGILWVILSGGTGGYSGGAEPVSGTPTARDTSPTQARTTSSPSPTSASPKATESPSASDVEEESPPASAFGSTTPSTDPGTGPGTVTAASTLDRCEAAADRLAGPLQEAQAAVDQWAVHVGAMNKLVTGAISLQQATAFWNSTRQGAQEHIADFDAATGVVRRRGLDCPGPAMVGTRAPAELRACSRHVYAMRNELDIAQAAIMTWHHHVLDMERLRAGTLSPTKATAMWLSMWQRGQQQINDYEAAAQQTRQSPGCDGSTGAAAQQSGSHAHGGSGGSGDMSDMAGMG